MIDDGVITTADEIAIQATNNGTLTWKDAHAQWLATTQRELSPPSFGKHIMDLGGGKRPKSFIASPVPPTIPNAISSVVTAQEASQLQRTPVPRASDPASVDASNHPFPVPTLNANNQPFVVPAASFLPLNSQVQPQVSPRPGASGASNQDSLEKQRRDITDIQIAMQNLGSVVTNLANQVASLRREGSRLPTTQSVGEDTPLELLMDNLSNVMTKAAEIDSLKMKVGVLERKVKRLENVPGSTNLGSPADSLNQQGPSLSTPQPSMATLIGMVAPVSNAQTSVSASPTAWHAGSNLKRTLQENAEPEPNAKRLKQDSSPYFPPQSGPLAASQMSSQALAHHFEQGKRPRGRPRKHPLPEFSLSASQTPQPQWTQTVAGNPFNDVSPSFAADYLDDRGQVVRRGGGVLNTYMSPDGRKGRTRPIRNDEGVLIRKDGKPDRRSMTSAENLRRTMLRKQEESKELGSDSAWALARSETASGKLAAELSPQLVVLDDDDSTHSSVDDALATWEKRSGPGSPSVSARKPGPPAATTDASRPADTHSDVMRKMFPQGLSEAARSVDFAAQLFRTNTPVAALSEKPLARMAVRSEIGAATAAPAATSTSAAAANTALSAAGDIGAPASAFTEPAVSPDRQDEAMPDVIDNADGSDGDCQEASQESSADTSSVEVLLPDATPTAQVQQPAHEVRDVRNTAIAADQQQAGMARTLARLQAPPPGTIATGDQATSVTLSEMREILGPQFFVCPVAEAIMEAQSVPKQELINMRTIFERIPVARTDMATFVRALQRKKAFSSLVNATRAAIANPGARDGSAATINLAREVLGEGLFICPVAHRIMASQTVPKESLLMLKSIFEKYPTTMTDIAVLLKQLEGLGGLRMDLVVQDVPDTETAAATADQDLTDPHTLLVILTKATRAAIAHQGTATTGLIPIDDSAKDILGLQFCNAPVAQKILHPQRLPNEAIALMRSIFERESEGRVRLEAFLEVLLRGPKA